MGSRCPFHGIKDSTGKNFTSAVIEEREILWFFRDAVAQGVSIRRWRPPFHSPHQLHLFFLHSDTGEFSQQATVCISAMA